MPPRHLRQLPSAGARKGGRLRPVPPAAPWTDCPDVPQFADHLAARLGAASVLVPGHALPTGMQVPVMGEADWSGGGRPVVLLAPWSQPHEIRRWLRVLADRPTSISGIVVASQAHPGAAATARLAEEFGLPVLLDGCTRDAVGGRTVRLAFLPADPLRSAYLASQEGTLPEPSVLAVIPCFNEVDVLASTIGRLRSQGCAVHVLDNWSTDGTWELACELADRDPLISCEQFPEEGKGEFEWARQLRRLAEVGASSDADWILHVDADEQLASFAPGVGLRQALGVMAASGFDVVDFTVLDFRPTVLDSPGSLPARWEFGLRTGHQIIERAWRNRGSVVDIASSGGHSVNEPGKRVAPVNLVLHHFPLRSPEHARRKIYADRLPRVADSSEQAKGWHRQYDGFRPDDPFLWDPTGLHPWNEQVQRDWMVELTTRSGLQFGLGSYVESPFPEDVAGPGGRRGVLQRWRAARAGRARRG